MNELEMVLDAVEGLSNDKMKDLGKKILVHLAGCNTKEEMQEAKEEMRKKLNLESKEFAMLIMAGMC